MSQFLFGRINIKKHSYVTFITYLLDIQSNHLKFIIRI